MRFHLLAVMIPSLLAPGVGSRSLSAQTATQTVTFRVISMSRASFSGSATPVFVRSATASTTPTSASFAGATYGITTNETNQKIAASLDRAMPAGVTLAVSLAAPTGAASERSTRLGTAAMDVVTGISAVSATALPIGYTLAGAAPAAPRSRTVTFTITAGL